MTNMTKVSTIIKGKRYIVQAGDVFQMPYENPTVHQIFVSSGELNETIYFEVIEKVNTSLAVVRVNEIVRFKNGQREVETYKEVVVGPNNSSKQKVDKPVDKMTKKELIEFAENNNIDIDKKAKKADILNYIKECV